MVLIRYFLLINFCVKETTGKYSNFNGTVWVKKYKKLKRWSSRKKYPYVTYDFNLKKLNYNFKKVEFQLKKVEFQLKKVEFQLKFLSIKQLF